MKREEDHFCRLFLRKNQSCFSYRAGTEIGFDAPRLAFLYRGSCRVEGDFGTLSIRPGDLWFLPKGVPYVSHWTAEENEVSYAMMEFDADFISLYYSTMQVLAFPAFEGLYGSLWERWEAGDSFGMLSSFYHILSLVLPQLERRENRAADRVMPALKFLREAPEAQASVKTLAALCYLSPSRFFELFREATGVSPIHYKNMIKASRARMLLVSGKSVEEVSSDLGFSSASYLRRTMKKHLGLTPKEAKKEWSV